MAMGNNPVNSVDPDGGLDGDLIPGLGNNPGSTMIGDAVCIGHQSLWGQISPFFSNNSFVFEPDVKIL